MYCLSLLCSACYIYWLHLCFFYVIVWTSFLSDLLRLLGQKLCLIFNFIFELPVVSDLCPLTVFLFVFENHYPLLVLLHILKNLFLGDLWQLYNNLLVLISVSVVYWLIPDNGCFLTSYDTFWCVRIHFFSSYSTELVYFPLYTSPLSVGFVNIFLIRTGHPDTIWYILFVFSDGTYSTLAFLLIISLR